jgi:hypothetical protein
MREQVALAVVSPVEADARSRSASVVPASQRAASPAGGTRFATQTCTLSGFRRAQVVIAVGQRWL